MNRERPDFIVSLEVFRVFAKPREQPASSGMVRGELGDEEPIAGIWPRSKQIQPRVAAVQDLGPMGSRRTPVSVVPGEPRPSKSSEQP